MAPKIINLPKRHLSYSQIQLWRSDKYRYKELYFNGNEAYKLSNSGMEYGKSIADLLEQEKRSDDLMTDAVLELLPKYDVRDKEIEAEITSKDGLIYVIGRPDTLNSETKEFREYKTGRSKWTQRKAQNHLQMFFYAMLIYLKYGVLLDHAYLDWVETEMGPDGIRPTGRIESFKVDFTIVGILDTMVMVSKIAKEIEVEYAMHVQTPKEAH